MNSVRHHYEQFLAPACPWIPGDFENACQSNVKLPADLVLSPSQSALAVDLGCVAGCQSLPLAERGIRVAAIDLCQELLDELTRRAGNMMHVVAQGPSAA